MKKHLLFIALFLFTMPLWAHSITNQELFKSCKDKAVAPQNFCYGFIIATANASEFYRNVIDAVDEYLDICFPKNISNQELVNDYLEWLNRNPSQLDSPAFLGVSSALSTKYSCPQAKQNKKAKGLWPTQDRLVKD